MHENALMDFSAKQVQALRCNLDHLERVEAYKAAQQ